ncbi:MAG TPA: hypothetical protein PKE30_05995 [Niabella sp.]|nr:hypothetical protein [Niabella sp.]
MKYSCKAQNNLGKVDLLSVTGRSSPYPYEEGAGDEPKMKGIFTPVQTKKYIRKKYLLLYAFACLLVISCNNSSKVNKSEEGDSMGQAVKTGDTTIVLDSITELDSVSAVIPAERVIEVTVPAATLPVKLDKTIVSETQSIYVTITDMDTGLLNASISHSKPDANLRISQVIMPDGSTDGPFGQQITFDARQKGDYVIIINKSNMASGSQIGDVVINIER